jgi:uncharacterized membrane protein YccC
VFLAGLAPTAVSFTAGQAAFTVTLLILFNILAPEGWQIGLVRIEDVVLGSAVSLAVGLLFWPRGATAALGAALAEAYADSARYLTAAVRFGSGVVAEPTAEATRAAAASRRLDDAFRTYLAERGAKPIPLVDVTSLVTGVVGLRLAGDAVLDLWRDRDHVTVPPELLALTDETARWYERFATALHDRGEVPAPLPECGRTADSDVRVVWTTDYLDMARRLQEPLVAPARAAIA